jgi:hypothetical protein
MDGATAVFIPSTPNGESNSQTVKALKFSEAKLFPRRIIAEKFDLRTFSKDDPWPDWVDSLSYGARRLSALALSIQSRSNGRGECLCIVVSSDGPIYFMPGDNHPVEPV